MILAAGKGTRMQPLTYEIPKPMLPVNGRPILAYTIELLPKIFDEIIFVVGYLGDQIREYFGDNYNGRKITYIRQNELLGTGHALTLCQEILKDRFLVMMGDDIYCANDINHCLEYERSVLVKEVLVEQDRNYGAMLADAEGNLVDIKETEVKAPNF